MNTKSLIAASVLALLGSGAAFAQVNGDTGGYDVPELHAPSTKTRAEVIAELQAARANGELRIGAEGETYVPNTKFVSTKSRAEVRAEVVKALQAGERLSYGDTQG
ncbi:DUF4148 domain-containing protein [Aquincola sp. MAHUQ-54]|uniref:DUF4148 domain-containing protein n=1 Tax=Aquincola agrisoli TaxID=3119538 RepID=A0AAW9QG91_9BURK